MHIKITRGAWAMPFPCGHLTATDKEFVKVNVGKVFPAVRANMNYYHLTENGCEVHVYNASEVLEED